MTSQPAAVLIIHGAYFQPPAWEFCINSIKDEKIVVECPALPSCGTHPTAHPTGTLVDDVYAVQAAAQNLLDAGHKITVLAHTRMAGSGAGVTSLVLLGAFLIQPGDSIPGLFTKYGYQSEIRLGYNIDETAAIENATSAFVKNPICSLYNDIAPFAAERLASQNVKQNHAAARGIVTGAPWKDLETVYVYILQDRAITTGLQERMVEDAVSAGGRIKTRMIHGGHCFFLAYPSEVVCNLRNIAERFSE
ncbi:hypothetical protein BJY00DRAFT_319898 [Aspergillus carlsbadensis]|nr:hypothetical protein BJY00DRAFT_319898 [Aspergillus carlsbadensis]